ncbi:MAG: type VI secretion system tip protein TssI/VgrG [Rhodanobacter sp.]
MPYSTRKRSFHLTTPLAEDVLLLHHFDGGEALSQPFKFRLTLASEDDAIDPAEVVGKRLTIRATIEDAEDESGPCWSGIVSSFGRSGSQWLAGADETQEMTIYEAVLVPWFWQLKLIEDCRIFQHLSIPDIVDQILGELQLGPHETDLSGSYTELDYCVQYDESNFDFISRLLEDAGIHYFFRHDPDEPADVLVLSDRQEQDYKGEIEHLRFAANWHEQDEPVVFALARRQRMRTGRVVLRDFDFTRPTQNLEVGVDTMLSVGAEKSFQSFRYPGGYLERNDGEGRAKLDMEIEEAKHELLDGASTLLDIRPGVAFQLDDAPNEVLEPAWRTLRAEHHGNNNLDGTGGEHLYRNEFTVMPLAMPYRPPRSTRKPRMRGPQTAIVTGPAGEEIYTDKYGRVKVHFFWDHLGTSDDKSSCWVRVSQAWAGRGWGAFFLPRIGMEVIVDFLDGDPDHPLVTGCVYNGDNSTPYALPGEMTKSTIKSWSSKGGDGFNEVRFEDKKGAEQLFIHAQKDVDLRVKNDRREWVEQDRSLIVKRDRLEEVHRSQHLYVKKDRITEVGGDDHVKLTGKQAVSIGGSVSLKVSGGVGESFQSHSEQVQSDYYLKAGANLVIEAGTMLTLKVGSNFIMLSSAGITMVGTMVMINSGGSAGVGSAASLVPPIAVTAAAVADKADPGQKMEVSPLAGTRPAGAPASSGPAHDAADPKNKDKKHYIEVELKDDAGKPVPGEKLRVTLPDGSTVAEGTTDEKGLFKVTNIDPGQCKVTFPKLDQEAWKSA